MVNNELRANIQIGNNERIKTKTTFTCGYFLIQMSYKQKQTNKPNLNHTMTAFNILSRRKLVI